MSWLSIGTAAAEEAVGAAVQPTGVETTAVEAKPGSTELGVFFGGFISNYFHQFYDTAIEQPEGAPMRDELNRLNPQFGLRFAGFLTPFVGLEAESSLIMASTQDSGAGVRIYGFRAQLMFQLPERFSPFAAAGAGLYHTRSDELGNDTDVPIHLGGGFRYFLSPVLAVRADARLVRGPSYQDPWTLNASYGEFTVGVSFKPGGKQPPPAPPPDLDPDKDGVVGSADECPTEHGLNRDGCPDRDTDSDGIVDRLDRCVDRAENLNGFEDEDGCPEADPDTDADGLSDTKDLCKDQAEDMDGFKDEDGCPELDNDQDGVTDQQDKCPLQTGQVENGGCPDTDSDNDGVVDRLDNCPLEAGTEKNHGCKAKQLVVMTKDQLKILDQVRFQTNSAKLNPRSNALLDNIVRVLEAHPEIIKVKVEGHTDDVGDDAKNLTLSQARAEAVVAYLAKKGVAAERLEAIGHGETKPLVEGKTKKAREANRRVEFNIVSQ